MAIAQVQLEELRGADKLWHLRQSSLVEGLSYPDLVSVAGLCSDRIYAKHGVIFRQGDCAKALGEDLLGPQEYRLAQATAHQEPDQTQDSFAP